MIILPAIFMKLLLLWEYLDPIIIRVIVRGEKRCVSKFGRSENI